MEEAVITIEYDSKAAYHFDFFSRMSSRLNSIWVVGMKITKEDVALHAVQVCHHSNDE